MVRKTDVPDSKTTARVMTADEIFGRDKWSKGKKGQEDSDENEEEQKKGKGKKKSSKRDINSSSDLSGDEEGRSHPHKEVPD